MLKTKMNRKVAYRAVIAGLFLVCSATVFMAAVKYGDSGGGGKEVVMENHDMGLFWLTIDNRLGVAGANCEFSGNWPTGDGPQYVYSAGVWVGYMDVGGNIYVSAWKNGNAGAGDWREIDPCTFGPLMSDASDWSDRPAGIEQISELDSFVSVDDSGADDLGPIGDGIEVWRHGYQWGIPGHDDFIVFEYTVFNTSGTDLPDVYIAMAFDNDIGGSLDYIDDLVLFEGNDTTDNWTNPTVPGEPWTIETPDSIPDENDTVNFEGDGVTTFGKPRMMAVMYDSGDETRDYPGYIGCRFINVTMSGDPLDDPDDPHSYPEYEVTGQHSWDIMNDPDSDIFRYGYMLDTGTFEEITTPYDWRMCPSVGPFNEVAADETIHWWGAIVMGADLNDMRMNSNQVYADYLGPDAVAGTDDDWVVLAPPVP
ncbi:MAG: hypothetical protein GY771_02795, partial [bacterium]|nr:hypothetical protein [bacterium]